MFDNDQIDGNDLPSAGNVSWQAMDPRFTRRLQAQGGIAAAFLVIGLTAIQLIFRIAFAGRIMPINIAYLWPVLILLVPLLLGWPVISVPRIGYAIRDRDILYKSGVFWQTATAVPFNRIQHVEKSSTLLDRRFGVATLQLFTAGGAGGDLKIHGLSEATAENLRAFIIDKVGDSH